MKTALIFAAGRGERLKPLTDTLPKALCRVRGIPLIEYHLQHLAAAGFKSIIINHAHLGDQIRRQLGCGKRWNVEIIYSPEPPGALETGGAIICAQHLLNDEPFATINADIMTDYDFSQLSLPEEKLAHLVLVKQPPYYTHGDFGLTETSLLSNQDRYYTFSGIACYHPSLLNRLKPGRFSITPIIRELAENQHISGEIYQGKWIDIGSTERLRGAQNG